MKPIAGYEDYMIDIDGNVYSMKSGSLRKKIPVLSNNGYYKVMLCKDGNLKNFYLHRLLYQAFVGEIPDEMMIDHIDRNKTNNSLDNMRVVTRQQNGLNTAAKGYYWSKKRNKWHAKITLNRKKICLGFYNTEAEAHAAYLQAKDKLHII